LIANPSIRQAVLGFPEFSMDETTTDKDWEYFGKTDPYWAVLTEERFRQANLDAAALTEFFASGERYVAWVLGKVRAHLDSNFKPARALDFGCGVGRLALSLASECEFVVGADVSESMLGQARLHAAQREISNLSLVRADDKLSGIGGSFDLINSYIVFQHIPSERGQRLFQALVDRLNIGGVGAIHFTYSKSAFDTDPANGWSAFRAETGGQAARKPRRRWSTFPWRRVEAAVQPPSMQMNPYMLNPIFHVLQLAGIRRVYLELTDHGGEYGVILFFQKQSDQSYSA
jgi:SAM-dependent methyltransferase